MGIDEIGQVRILWKIDKTLVFDSRRIKVARKVVCEVRITITESKPVPGFIDRERMYTGLRAVSEDGEIFQANWNCFSDDGMNDNWQILKQDGSEDHEQWWVDATDVNELSERDPKNNYEYYEYSSGKKKKAVPGYSLGV